MTVEERKMLIREIIKILTRYDRISYQSSAYAGEPVWYLHADPFYNQTPLPIEEVLSVYNDFYAGQGILDVWEKALKLWQKHRKQLLEVLDPLEYINKMEVGEMSREELTRAVWETFIAEKVKDNWSMKVEDGVLYYYMGDRYIPVWKEGHDILNLLEDCFKEYARRKHDGEYGGWEVR